MNTVHIQQNHPQMECLLEISRSISTRQDLSRILKTIVEQARQLFGCEVVVLCLLDKQGRCISVQDSSGPDEALQNPAGQDNPLSSNRPHPGNQDPVRCEEGCDLLAWPYRTSHISAQLLSGERLLGSLCCGSLRPNAFNPDDSLLLNHLAHLAASAVENERLSVEVEKSRTLVERQRLAAEMVEGLSQTLSYLNIMVNHASEQASPHITSQMAEALRRLQAGIQQAAGEARRAVASLREEASSSQTLQERLVDLVRQFSQPGRPLIALQASMDQRLTSSQDQIEQITYIAHEAIDNACTHAHASQINISLEYHGSFACLSIEDDGQGFDPEQSEPISNNHLGLTLIRNRAERLGGQVQLDTAPGSGTRLHFTWPVGVVE